MKQQTKTLAYMSNTILRANNSVLNVLAEFDKIIFRQVMSACKYNSDDLFSCYHF